MVRKEHGWAGGNFHWHREYKLTEGKGDFTVGTLSRLPDEVRTGNGKPSESDSLSGARVSLHVSSILFFFSDDKHPVLL